MKKKNACTVLLSLSAAWSLTAQTSNTGIITVEENTIISTMADFTNGPQGVLINDGEAYIYRDFKNDGVVSHSDQSEGLTRFEGGQAQVIGGSMESEFRNILFYNPSPAPSFLLEGDIRVNGVSEFNQGIIDNRNFGGIFLFSDNATHADTWNGSFVDGKVDKEGPESFLFPVGGGNLFRYCTISAPQESNSKFEAIYHLENSNDVKNHTDKDESIEFIDNQEYWVINKLQGNLNVILTLSWSQSTTPASIYTAGPEELIIVGYDETANKWINLGGVADPNNQTVSTPVELTAYGYFTLARAFKKWDDCVEIYNVITPLTKDGINDFFQIECLENYPDNSVEIFNRWGVKVFKTKGYGIDGNVFEGYSAGRTTVGGSGLLPTGTYFYILNYNAKHGTEVTAHKKIGYLYLNAE
ncbi:MAG: gliding motility-associated C-terminal domain-containing protein [Chitinophagaceae bacterium]|nr:MAG: gliding motility-associated C-terminal domain-containing protein [Chitinophagaceae bacterium]